MSLYERIKKRDRLWADSLAGGKEYFTLSPTRASLSRVLMPAIKTHLCGRCLDAGAGRTAYAAVIRDAAEEYISLDIKPHSDLDAIGSLLNAPFKRESFDSAFCSQVLEHVPDPERALREIHACLQPGGTLIVSVPHLAYLHNEPHDYFRFTKHGLRVILERAGFETVAIEPAGGLLSFLGHIPSVLIKALAFPIPGVNRAVLRLNAYYSTWVAWLDERVEPRKLFALNYVAVARKKQAHLRANRSSAIA